MAAELAAQPGAPLCPCGCGQVGVAVASCCRMCVARWQSASGGSQGGFMNRARLQLFRPAWRGQWWCTHGPFVPTQCMSFYAAANSDGCCPAEGRLPHVDRHRAAGQQRLALQRRGGGPPPPPPACARCVCAGDGRGAGRGRMRFGSCCKSAAVLWHATSQHTSCRWQQRHARDICLDRHRPSCPCPAGSIFTSAHCRRPFSPTAGRVTHVDTILPCPPLPAHPCHPHIAGLAEELIIAQGSKDVHTRDAACSAAAGLEAHGAWQRCCFHCRQPEPAGPEGPGHLRVCDGCKSRLFCGKGCLNAAWPRHKRECKQLAAL